MNQSTHQFHKMLFHISKYLAWNAAKTVEEKKMYITNFINTFTKICTYVICDKNDSKYK